MKRIEKFINVFDFGIFFPIWFFDCIFRNISAKVIIWIEKKVLPEEKFEKRNKEWENSLDTMIDLQLFCNYNMIDSIIGFSYVIMSVLLVDTLLPSGSNNALPLSVTLVVFGIISMVVIYYFFHRHDKREKYFIEFDKEPMRKKWKWAALSWGLFIGSWVSVILIHHYFAG